MSEFSRETLLNIIETDHVQCGEASALARMALAAMDSEPDCNERQLFCSTDTARMKKVISVYAGSEATPLYRHAQPAPVVDADDNFYSWFGREWTENYQHNQYTTAAKQMLGVMAESAWKAGRRAAMLQAEPVTTATKLGNSPVIPDGYVMVPMRLTAENGAKGALSGEFSETKFVNCPECFGDDECETCDGSGRIEITVPVTWTTIKEIWAKGVEHFAAAPQEVSDA